MTGVRIRPATSSDLPAVLALLRAAGLPEDVEAHFGGFLIADLDDIVAGAVGTESCGDAALLRSLVVAPERRCAGLGAALAREMIARLRAKGFGHVFLLTTDAGGFFERLAFRDSSREAAPSSIRETREFRELCPASARLMKLELRT